MQSRWMSLMEATANIAVGYCLAVLTQVIVFPLFGLSVSLGENLGIGAVFGYTDFCVSGTAQEGMVMMQGFDGMGMGWGMGLFGLLILVFLVLAIAALIKYLRT